MPKRSGRRSASQTIAPKKDRIVGSKVNPKGSASSEASASKIKLDAKTIVALNEKLNDFKGTHKTNKVSLNDLKAVYRRGLGAYSSTHRPTISGGKPNTRNAWAMARVNKFLEKASGKKVKKAYVQDDDLLKMHLGGDMSKHLAPNGKPSNLTHEQWHLVRTPEFKAWFGDWENNPEGSSKVVDENGEPMVVYRAIRGNYDYEKRGNQFFTPNLKYAKIFGNSIVSCFLNIRDLLDFEYYNKIIRQKGIETDFNEGMFQMGDAFLDKNKNLWYYNQISLLEFDDFDLSNEIFNRLKEVDGIVGYEAGYYGQVISYLVWKPNQIKLADGTNTTFDASNPDIRYADGGEVTNACIEEVVNIINSIQRVKDFYIHDGKLVIVFEDELMVYSVEMMNYHLEQFTMCHDVIEPEVNLNYGENYKSVFLNLKVDDATIGQFAKGGAIDDGQENFGQPKVTFDKIPLLHETSLEASKLIDKNGFKLFSKNKKITKGLYTIPLAWKQDKFNANHIEYIIRLKPNSKIFWTNCKNASDFYYGQGNKFYENLYNNLNTNGNVVDFLRVFEIWLKDNGYCGVQQGGEIVITNLSCIDSYELYEQFKDGGAIDGYTKQEIKKAYVSIRIRREIEQSAPFSYEYIVESIDQKPFEELSNGVLDGVLGVSTSSYNVSEWLVHRDCLVVMPFNEFLNLNNTEQVKYFDADYLTKNGLEPFFRLYDRKTNDDSAYYGVLQTMFPKISNEFGLEATSGVNYGLYYLVGEMFNPYNSSKFLRYVAEQPRIQSPEMFAKIVCDYINSGKVRDDYYRYGEFENVKPDDIIKPLTQGIVSSGKIYRDESEWILKDKKLVVPKGSQLFFVVPTYPNFKEENEKLIDAYGLRDLYKIGYINQADLNRFQQQRWKKKDENFKKELDEFKGGVEKKISNALVDIENEILGEFERNLWREVDEDEYLHPEYFKDYDGNKYSNYMQIPEVANLYNNFIYKLSQIIEGEIPNVVKNKNKYHLSGVYNQVLGYIQMLEDENMYKDFEFMDEYGTKFNYYDLIYKMKRAFKDIDISKYADSIKNRVGGDLYRAFSKDELMFKDGGTMDKYEISDYWDEESYASGGELKTKKIITDKIGWNESVADFFIEADPKLSIWLADGFMKYHLGKNILPDNSSKEFKEKYGIDISDKPTKEEWNSLPMSIKKALINELYSNSTMFFRYGEIYEERGLTRADNQIRVILDWLKHPITPKQNLKELSITQALDKAQQFHDELQAIGGDVDFVEPEENTIIITYPKEANGVQYYWVEIPKSFCDLESKRMGHCGRTGSGDSLLSLRSVTPYGKGHTINDSHVTIAYNNDNALFYQVKGKKNAKPSEKYFPYIFDLVKTLAKEDRYSKIVEIENQQDKFISERNSILDLLDVIQQDIDDLRSQNFRLEDMLNKVKNNRDFDEIRNKMRENENEIYRLTDDRTENRILEGDIFNKMEMADDLIGEIRKKYRYGFGGFGSEYSSKADYGWDDMTNEQVAELYQINPELFKGFGGELILYTKGLSDKKPNTKFRFSRDLDYLDDIFDFVGRIDPRYIKRIISGEELGSNSYSRDNKEILKYHLDDLDSESVGIIEDKISEITGLPKEEVHEDGIEYYLSGDYNEEHDKDFDFDEIFSRINRAIMSAEDSAYIDYRYKEIKEELGKIGKIIELDDTDVDWEVDILDHVSMNQLSELSKNYDSDALSYIFIEGIFNDEIEKPKFELNDNPYISIDSQVLNEYFHDDDFYENGGILGEYAFADKDTDVSYIARRLQGTKKYEDNNKFENKLLYLLSDWTMYPSNAKQIYNEKNNLTKLKNQYPKIFKPNFNGLVYRGIGKFPREVRNLKNLKLSDFEKVIVNKEPYYLYKNPIKYSPIKETESWTTSPRIANNFGRDAILVTKIDDNFYMNPKIMNAIHLGRDEEEILHLGKDFSKNVYVLIGGFEMDNIFEEKIFKNKIDVLSKLKYKEGGEVDDHKETYKKWKSLVNMSASELKRFYDSEEGKKAGLTPSQASAQGIDSGRESARWILKMKATNVSDWTPQMWKWAKKQISFISRMSGNKGGLYDDKGRKTRKHTSLLIWGHNPEK
jgi:hypothetical protein